MTGVLVPTSGEAEWLAARRAGVTASEIAVVMGLAPDGWASPYSLWHRKAGLLPEGGDESDRLDLGRYLEAYVAGRLMRRRPDLALLGSGRELYAHPERPWQLATPDRLACELLSRDVEEPPATAYGALLGVAECKTSATFDGWGPDGSDEIPVYYRCQLLWQMDVMAVTRGWLPCVFLPGGQLRVYELALDDQAQADLALMREEAMLFLRSIDRRTPPEPDWRPATAATLKHLHPDVDDTDVPVSTQLAQWYQAACRRVKAADQRKAELENKLRTALGRGHRVVDPGRGGLVIARRDVYDVRPHERKGYRVDKLVPVKPRAPKEAPQP